MKFTLALMSAAIAVAFVMPHDAEAKRGYRKKPHYATYYAYRRPASVASNGLCQRDTGTPTSQLSFRNKCDTEEFWTRMQERGTGRP